MDVRALLFASGSVQDPFVPLSLQGQESFNSSGFDPLALSADGQSEGRSVGVE